MSDPAASSRGAYAEVRTALVELLRDAVLPGLGAAALQPFLPLLMAHVCAAMTALAPDVRWEL